MVGSHYMTKLKNDRRSLTLTNIFSKLKKIDYRDLFLITLLVIVNGVITILWLQRNTFPPGSDESYYLYVSIEYYELLTNPDISSLKEFIILNEFRPPFRLLFTLPFYALFGVSRDVAVGTQIIFQFILFLSTYLICKKMFTREVGLLACFIVATTPILFGLSRNFISDLPAAAMITLSIYLLLKTQYFTNKRFSFIFGFVLGLTILIKIESLMFLLFPILYVLYKSDLLRLRSFLYFLFRSPIHLIIIILSGMMVGAYLYAFAELIIWPDNDKFGTGLLSLFLIIGIIIVMAFWLLFSITLAYLSKSSITSVLRKDALSFLSAGFLLLILINYDHSVKNLHFWALLLFLLFIFILKASLMNKYIRIAWSNRKSGLFSNHPWINLIRGTTMMLVTTLWWYIPAARRVIPFAIYNPLLPKESEGGHANLLSWESMSYYFIGLLNQQIYLYFWFLLVAVVLIMWHLRSRIMTLFRSTSKKKLLNTIISKDRQDHLILVLWIVIPYIGHRHCTRSHSRVISVVSLFIWK